MNRVAGAPLAPGYTVVCFDQIESEGRIQYAFMTVVFDDASHQPVLFVASEVNAMAASLGGGSHFLGVFAGEGHANYGASNDWADPKKFFPEALRIARERFPSAEPHG